MSVRLIFRPIAARELHEAIAWYERQREGLGLEFKDVVERTLGRIAATPERFHPVRGMVRRALLGRFPYAIHFVPEQEVLVILAVFHTKRDPRRLEGRL